MSRGPESPVFGAIPQPPQPPQPRTLAPLVAHADVAVAVASAPQHTLSPGESSAHPGGHQGKPPASGITPEEADHSEAAEWQYVGLPEAADVCAAASSGPFSTPLLLSPRSGGHVDEAFKDMADVMPSKAALGRGIVGAYGTGHMLNDLTSACWFTYLLIFLTDIGLSPQQAATVMMAGQLADAAATLLVGRLIDRFGHFKAWHLAGCVLVALSFSSVFGGCLVCSFLNSNSTLLQTLSYSISAAIFNCGWAATQVSHMSMVNSITANPSSRVALNSSRNAFTMVANLTLYCLAFASFYLLPSGSPTQVQNQFRWIAAGAVGLGLLFVSIFYFSIPEPRCRRSAPRSASTVRSAWLFWFRQWEYYQVALVYTLTRLICNVSQAMLPFFLVRDLNMHQSAKAAVPAAVYIVSFGVSIFLQEMHWTAARLKTAYGIGALLWLITSDLVFVVDYHQQGLVYLMAAFMGAASALILVCATSMEGVLVGHRLHGCAFVYGSLSFLDKVSSGIALYIIETTNSARPFCGSVGPLCRRSAVRWVLSVLPVACGALATVVAWRTKLDDSDHCVTPLDDSSLTQPLVPSCEKGKTSVTELLLGSNCEPNAVEVRALQ